MLYYRYRPINELSLKELRYNELYFSSTKENNDPYDGNVFLSYKFDLNKWQRLFNVVFARIGLPTDMLKNIVKKLAQKMIEDDVKTYNDVIDYDYTSALFSIDSNLGKILAYKLSNAIKEFVFIYKPSDMYTVSFSKINDSMLMWSHYASKHKGFCLIFRSIDGCLYQNKNNKRTAIGRNTPNGIAPHSSFGIGDKFHFKDVIYCKECSIIDASRFMAHGVSDYKFKSEEERIAFAEENYNKSFEKHICWEYEQESRLVIEQPTPWLFGNRFEYTKDERLFYYQPTQLVGIICGAWMDNGIKTRIKEIVNFNREQMWLNVKDDAVFDFVLFQAKISNEKRGIQIVPELIYSSTKIYKSNDKEFYNHYESWEKGSATVFDGNGGAKRAFIP